MRPKYSLNRRAERPGAQGSALPGWRREKAVYSSYPSMLSGHWSSGNASSPATSLRNASKARKLNVPGGWIGFSRRRPPFGRGVSGRLAEITPR
jgi:hypothetical protein